jgi:predicted GNAT family N-acyltransferase
VAHEIGSAEYRVEPLGSTHDRAAFCCGSPELDAYLQRRAGQDQTRKLASVFILTKDGKTVAGFYTLSAHTILAAELPVDLAKRLPRFPVPVTLLGRMAIAQSLQGQGWGEFLLVHALKRAALGSRQVASWAVVVDAKAGARDFYLNQDFTPFPARPERLFLQMKTIEEMFEL